MIDLVIAFAVGAFALLIAGRLLLLLLWLITRLLDLCSWIVHGPR